MKLILPLLIAASLTNVNALIPRDDSINRSIRVKLVVNASGKDIFSGYVRTRGHNVTTPTGGTHKCDGTNNGENPRPGATPTSALADAAKKAGFSFDG